MSHELRNPDERPLSASPEWSYGGQGTRSRTGKKKNLNKVTQSADHLLELINSLLDLSKIAAGQMDVDAGPFSVKKLVASCCSLVEPLTKPGVNLTHEVSDEADEACTDENKLRHIIGNLLSNAVKFTDRGEVSVTARTLHDQFLISISDTGIGMPKEGAPDHLR